MVGKICDENIIGIFFFEFWEFFIFGRFVWEFGLFIRTVVFVFF